jgi:hypothetical protein
LIAADLVPNLVTWTNALVELCEAWIKAKAKSITNKIGYADRGRSPWFGDYNCSVLKGPEHRTFWRAHEPERHECRFPGASTRFNYRHSFSA